MLEIGDLTKSAHFSRAYSTPLGACSPTLLQREAQHLLHSTFSCMLFPFFMFSREPHQGKVKYSPLYGRGSRVTILVGRYFQFKMLENERASKKTLVGTHFC